MSTDDSSPIHQARNSIFQRLNKLANTKLLKSFISGQQLIDLNNLEIKTHNNEGLKSKKMVKILEDKAHQAVDTIKMKNIRFNDNPKGEITKKLLTEAELPSNRIFFDFLIIFFYKEKSFLKPLGSLQVNSNSEILNQVSENKPSILRSIDSFEIEGPSLDLTTNKQSHQNIEDIEDTFPNLEIEQMYDIRKISLRKISNRSESPIGEVGYHKEKQKISSLGANEKKDEKKDKVLRKGFSYSDFELGGDNKRKITFDRRFEQQKNGKRICNRIKKRIREIMDISKLKLKLENSFVDVVITCNFYVNNLNFSTFYIFYVYINLIFDI